MSAKRKLKQSAKVFFKPGTRRFKVARKIAEVLEIVPPLSLDNRYLEWVERTEPYTWSDPIELDYKPKISVVVPVFNPPAQHLLPMAYSVVNQTYDNWELILVNASTKPECRRQAENLKSADERIRVVNLQTNKGIAGNTNAGIEKASGDYIALLDHDDLLAPAALYETVLAIQNERNAGLIYSDEDKITANGEERFDPHLKPDWSPQLLRELNYLNHFTVIKKDLIEKIGGYRHGFDGAQDYDLFLRLADERPAIIHVPKVLYHWRTSETSTANDFSSKKNILDAGVRALEEHLERNRQAGTIAPIAKQPGFYKIRYAPAAKGSVAVIIMPSPIRSQYKVLVETIVTKLRRTDLAADIYAEELVEKTTYAIPDNAVINYIAAKTNRKFIEKALERTSAETLIIIGAALVPGTETWLEDLSSVVAQVSDIGLAVPLITAADNKTVVDAGQVLQDGRTKSLFRGLPKDTHTYIGNVNWVRNLDSVSGRCFAVRTKVFKDYLKTASGTEINAQDMCAYLASRGLQIVLWPFVTFTYRGELAPGTHEAGYFSPALSVTKEDFNLPKTINMPDPEETDD